MSDRRICKSKAALKQALITMMKKKDFSKITIKELCELADVNRSTFYANYEDIYGILKDVHYDILDTLHETVGSDWGLIDDDSEEAFTSLLEMVKLFKDNKEIFALFLNNSEGALFQMNMFTYYKEKYQICSKEVYSKYILMNHVFGWCATTYSWIKDDCVMPCEEMAQLLWDISSPFRELMAKHRVKQVVES